MTDVRKERWKKYRKILENFSFLAIGKTVGNFFAFILFVVLSRTYGQEGIGAYSFAMAFTGFFVVFADFGLHSLTVKEVSRLNDSLGNYFGSIVSLRFILSFIVFVLLLCVLPLLPFCYETKVIIVLIGVHQLLYKLMDGFASVFVAREETYLAGLLEVSFRMVGALAGIIIVMMGKSLVVVLAVLPIVAVCQLIFCFWLVTKKCGKIKLTTSLASLIRILRSVMPYGLSLFLYQIYSRIDVVFLGLLLGSAAAGIYNVALRVIVFFIFVPYLIALSLFPLSSRLYKSERGEFTLLYHKSLRMAVLIGIPVASGLCLIATDLIDLLFGNAFIDSVIVLRILAWLFLLACINRIMGVFLMSCDKQAERTKCQWKVVFINVVGHLIMIPIFGVRGAAIVTVISEAILMILFAMRLKPVVQQPQISLRLLTSCIGAVSFYIVFYFLPSLSMFIVIPVSVMIYVGVLFLFKDIRENEMYTLFSIVKMKSELTLEDHQEISQKQKNAIEMPRIE